MNSNSVIWLKKKKTLNNHLLWEKKCNYKFNNLHYK